MQNTMDYIGCRRKARILVYFEPGGIPVFSMRLVIDYI